MAVARQRWILDTTQIQVLHLTSTNVSLKSSVPVDRPGRVKADEKAFPARSAQKDRRGQRGRARIALLSAWRAGSLLVWQVC